MRSDIRPTGQVSQLAEISSITAQALRACAMRTGPSAKRAKLSNSERARLKELEREVRELLGYSARLLQDQMPDADHNRGATP